MKETSDILAGFELLRAEGKPAALATVVAVCGSAYRRPGARMLIAADGRTWGGVSGGCLERDVAQRAQAIIGSSEAINCRYDTTDDEDLATGVATGCRGTVDLFIEPVSAESPGPMPWLAEAKKNRRAIALATVIRSKTNSIAPAAMRVTLESPIVGSALADAGSTVSRSPASAEADTACAPSPSYSGERAGVRGGLSSDIHPAKAPHPIPLSCIQGRGSQIHTAIEASLEPGIFDSCRPIVSIELDGHAVDIFVERIQPPTSLVIFGGGPDVVPVVAIAKTLGWHVTVVAARPANHIRERFALADAVHVTSSDDPTAAVELRPDDVIALMTHNYPRDLRILSSLKFQPRYLGILGPRRRTLELLADLRPAGIAFNNVHAPIGLDIGAQSPEAIALSIVAEIQTILSGGGAGFLRDRSGPIHTRGAETPEPQIIDEIAPNSRRGPACPT